MWLAMFGLATLLGGCANHLPGAAAGPGPDESRPLIDRYLPLEVSDRGGWIDDIYAGFAAHSLQINPDRVCAVLAVIEQESNFRVNPVVPDMGNIALREIDNRADRAGVPRILVHTALAVSSSNGLSYEERIRHARTEKDLSDLYEEFIGRVPLGRSLFETRNPVRTRGPMQVNVAFAAEYSARNPYPFPVKISIADELFSRRGSLYFGIAHLLDYRAPYDSYLYRFADFNAGQYASRNAAFQKALGAAARTRVTPDGALLPRDQNPNAPGSTELAARKLEGRLNLSDDEIHSDLERGKGVAFERSDLYAGVFRLAEQTQGRSLPRATVPSIVLKGPKISRPLTTDWYAHRVDGRFARCLKR